MSYFCMLELSTAQASIVLVLEPLCHDFIDPKYALAKKQTKVTSNISY